MIMGDHIQGKRILLICQDFYGYDVAMKDTLYSLGAKHVVLYNAAFFRGSFREHRSPKTLFFYLQDPHGRTKWTEKLIQTVEPYEFDILLCIALTPFKKYFIDYLRTKNPQIKTFLFLWDTVSAVQAGFQDYFEKFDYIYSFDRDDCQKYGFEYYPDFYMEPEHKSVGNQYDLCFIGTMYPRSETIKRACLLYHVNQFCESHHLKSFLYLRYYNAGDRKSAFEQRVFNLVYRDYLKTVAQYAPYGFMQEKKIPLSQVNEIQSSARVLLDINHANRQGMTINCITALATGKKLITTNARIKEESFYNPNNIYIINEENPVLDIHFFESDVEKMDMTHLKMDNWLLHILGK